MQLIPMAVGMGQSAAQNPNQSIGGQGGLGLDKIDPIGKFIVGKVGDPYNLYGEKNNPNALFFPGSSAAGSGPTTLPNLGAASMMPHAPGGSFMPVNTSGGQFNAMANQSAGGLFNPAQSQNAKGSTSSKGAAPQPMSPMVKAGLDLNRSKK